MIKFNGISKAYGGRRLLERFSLIINPGEKCALVGHNGSGKTTLFRMITEEESPDSGDITTPKGYRIGILKQHLDVTEPTLLQEAAKGLAKGKEDELYRVKIILMGLGFSEEDFDKSPEVFSGGYRIRIHLCKLLVSEPDCLLLDEPSNYLDIVSIRWLERFLQKWKGELIMISHDRELLDSICTHTIGIHRQSIKKVTGGTEAYFTQLMQEEEIHERTRQNLTKKREHLESYIERFGAKASKASQAQSRAKALEKMPVLDQLAKMQHLDFEFRYAPISSQKIIEATDVSFKYPSDDGEEAPDLIKSFSHLIENGDKICIIGKNGKGKSTLLRVLAQQLQPTSGTIKVAASAVLGYFGQTHIDRLNKAHTIQEEISLANPKLSYTEVKNICGVMMFSGDVSEKSISVLSGGERSRVLLGKILASPCNLLLLDEPTNHLDMESVESLVSAVENFPGTVLMVTHSEWILRRIPNKLIICREEGQEIFLGSYDEFLEKRGWDEEGSKKPPKSAPKRNEKQERAALVNQKSQRLSPIKKQMEQIEKAISQKEVLLNQDTVRLTEAATTQNTKAIVELSKTIDATKKELEKLYEEYDRIALSYEEQSNK